jgi:hypothetical protein
MTLGISAGHPGEEASTTTDPPTVLSNSEAAVLLARPSWEEMCPHED